jgi:hypothetical protein
MGTFPPARVPMSSFRLLSAVCWPAAFSRLSLIVSRETGTIRLEVESEPLESAAERATTRGTVRCGRGGGRRVVAREENSKITGLTNG